MRDLEKTVRSLPSDKYTEYRRAMVGADIEELAEDLAAVCKHLNIQVKTVLSTPRYRKASKIKTPKRKSK